MKKLIFAFLLLLLCIVLMRNLISYKTGNTQNQKTEILENPRAFIFMGDTGAATPEQFAVGQSIKNYCKAAACDAAFILGDVIYEEGVTSVNDPQFIEKFEKPYQDIAFPFYIAFGNHDYLGCTQCYLEYQEKSQKWKMPASFYKQSFSDLVDVFVIDTEQFNQEQQTWLKNNLTQSLARWKIVAGHRPLVSYEETKVLENWNGKKELKDIVCNSAAAYISGHAHVLEFNSLENCSAKQIVSGGGGAYTRKLTNSAKNQLFGQSSYGYVVLKSKNEELSADFLNQNQQVLYTAGF